VSADFVRALQTPENTVGTRVLVEPADAEITAAKPFASLALVDAKEGERLTLQMKNEAAIEKYKSAIAAFGRAVVSESDYGFVARCYIHLGAVWLFKGKRGKADDAFRHAIALGTNVRPDPLLFNPNVIARYQHVEQELIGSAPAQLVVNGKPEGATVWIDGKRAATLPAKVSGLLPGWHWVTVTLPGYRTFAAYLEATPGSSKSSDAFLPVANPSSKMSLLAVLEHASTSGSEDSDAQSVADEGSATAVIVVDRLNTTARVWPAKARQFSDVLHGDSPALLVASIKHFLLADPPPEVAAATARPPVKIGAAPTFVNPAVALLPFGVGQFVERRPGAGAALLSAETLLLAANIVTAVIVFNERLPDGTFRDAARDQALQVVNIAALGVLAATVVVGAVDGLQHRARP
jgi:hypothetical protein